MSIADVPYGGESSSDNIVTTDDGKEVGRS